MSRWTALALAAGVAAAACGIASAVLWDQRCQVEGAYFNRSEGAPAYAGVFESSCGELTLSDPFLWLGAAVAFAVMGAAVLALSRLRRG